MLLRNKPILRYCGLTIIVSNPSRFDSLNLASANGGVLLNKLLQPELNVMQCDIRVADDSSSFLPRTNCIMLMGDYAMHRYTNSVTGNNTLNEMRGSPLYIDNIPTIASYPYQEAADFKAYEQTHNEAVRE